MATLKLENCTLEKKVVGCCTIHIPSDGGLQDGLDTLTRVTLETQIETEKERREERGERREKESAGECGRESDRKPDNDTDVV